MTDPNLSVCPICGATLQSYFQHMQWHEANNTTTQEV